MPTTPAQTDGIPRTLHLDAPQNTVERSDLTVGSYCRWAAPLRDDIRRLERLLDAELGARSAADAALVAEASLIEERHALALAELILRIRLNRD